MRITGADWKAGTLILKTSDADAIRFALTFEEGDYSLLRAKPKRSLDANAYAWVLISKIASAVRLTKEEVYRSAIRDIGGNSETVCIQEKGLDTLVKCWEANGMGWQAETFPSKLKGCVNVILYYGSSAYDSTQMSVLIDHLVQDAKALGIETLPPGKLAGMMEEWDG